MGERCLARLLAAGRASAPTAPSLPPHCPLAAPSLPRRPQLVVWDYRSVLQASDASPAFATTLLKLHADVRYARYLYPPSPQGCAVGTLALTPTFCSSAPPRPNRVARRRRC